jgi:hypothetical protein
MAGFDPISAAIDFGSKIVDRIWPDATEKQKAEANLVIAELAHSETLFSKEVEDRDSARKREAEIAVSDAAPTINKVITPVLAIGTILLSFLLFYIVAFDTSVFTNANKDIIIYILGVLSAIDTQIIGYYFGSSSQSADKTKTIESILRK